MKHVIIFEKFLVNESNASGPEEFQFFPFDQQGEPASKYSLPETASFGDLMKMNESGIPDSAWQPGKGAGLFISHSKTPGGFVRAVLRSVNPLSFDISFFNDDYDKVSEELGVNPQNLGQSMKKAEGFKFIDDIRKSFPQLYTYLSSGSKRSDLAADLGELFY